MNTIKVFTVAGVSAGEKTVDEQLLILDRGQQAVKDTVVAIMNGARAGTASTKNKAEVAGSGKKPWKQKGTGRASFGSSRNPVWRGGGVAFGPKPRDFSQKVNKKVAALAFGRALSDKLVAGEVSVVENLNFTAPKTKEAATLLTTLGCERSTLFVVSSSIETDANANFFLASGNIARVGVCESSEVDVYMLCRFKNIIVTAAAFDELLARIPTQSEK